MSIDTQSMMHTYTVLKGAYDRLCKTAAFTSCIYVSYGGMYELGITFFSPSTHAGMYCDWSLGSYRQSYNSESLKVTLHFRF